MTKYQAMTQTLSRLGILKYLNLAFSVDTPNGPLKLPVLSSLGLQNVKELSDGRERYLDQLFAEAMRRRPGAFVDVGVNIGQTLAKVKGLRREQAYVGFEPNPACVFYANRMVSLNGFPDCKIIPCGLHERATVMKLQMRYGEDDPMGTVATNLSTTVYDKAKYVTVAPGDTLLAELEITAISLLKIDVEGAEMEVLNGLRKTLATIKPLTVCEIMSPKHQGMTGDNAESKRRAAAIEAQIKGEGYALGRMHKSGRIVPIDHVQEHIDETRYGTFDFVFVPPGDEWVFELDGARAA